MVDDNDLLIKPGERMVIIGSTGSGKTQMLLAQMRGFPKAPIFVLDSKGDESIQHFMEKEQQNNHVKINDISKIRSSFKAKQEFVWIYPDGAELTEPELLDNYLQAIYNVGKPCLICIDEVYQVHKGLKALPGLANLLTRGRSKGIATISCTQRPSMTSRFVYTESSKFIIYRLNDLRDNKTLTDMGIPFKDISLDKYHFFCYKGGESAGTVYAPLELKYNAGFTVSEKTLSRKV